MLRRPGQRVGFVRSEGDSFRHVRKGNENCAVGVFLQDRWVFQHLPMFPFGRYFRPSCFLIVFTRPVPSS